MEQRSKKETPSFVPYISASKSLPELTALAIIGGKKRSLKGEEMQLHQQMKFLNE